MNIELNAMTIVTTNFNIELISMLQCCIFSNIFKFQKIVQYKSVFEWKGDISSKNENLTFLVPSDTVVGFVIVVCNHCSSVFLIKTKKHHKFIQNTKAKIWSGKIADVANISIKFNIISIIFDKLTIFHIL